MAGDAPTPRPRPALAGLPVYRPGRSAEVAMARHALASNEQPWGPLPSVAKAVEAAVERGNRYPDHRAEALRAALAERLDVARQALEQRQAERVRGCRGGPAHARSPRTAP